MKKYSNLFLSLALIGLIMTISFMIGNYDMSFVGVAFLATGALLALYMRADRCRV